jgi:hypothetical protein
MNAGPDEEAPMVTDCPFCKVIVLSIVKVAIPKGAIVAET